MTTTGEWVNEQTLTIETTKRFVGANNRLDAEMKLRDNEIIVTIHGVSRPTPPNILLSEVQAAATVSFEINQLKKHYTLHLNYRACEDTYRLERVDHALFTEYEIVPVNRSFSQMGGWSPDGRVWLQGDDVYAGVDTLPIDCGDSKK